MSNKTEIRDDLILTEGTLVKVKGIPFKLVEDTPVQGTQANLESTKIDFPTVGKSKIEESTTVCKAEKGIVILDNHTTLELVIELIRSGVNTPERIIHTINLLSKG